MKPDTTDSEVQKVKDDIKAQGGEITHEYNIIKGFAYVPPTLLCVLWSKRKNQVADGWNGLTTVLSSLMIMSQRSPLTLMLRM